ncbi:hypothetical protein PV703_15565 [Streptomyces sp. ME01-24h]|nr:hypothetical protein [Streptomyces sp. ME01-24h]
MQLDNAVPPGVVGIQDQYGRRGIVGVVISFNPLDLEKSCVDQLSTALEVHARGFAERSAAPQAWHPFDVVVRLVDDLPASAKVVIIGDASYAEYRFHEDVISGEAARAFETTLKARALSWTRLSIAS